MKKVFEKIIEKLEEEKKSYFLTIANTGDEKLDCAYEQVGVALDKAIEIVKHEEITEYAKPLTKNLKCIWCDADVVIHISKYNGHKRFHCNKCGCYVMEQLQ